MEKNLILALTMVTSGLMACKEEGPVSQYEYQVHIHQPTEASQVLGATLEIEVDFESHTGQPVHHINVRIYNKSTLAEVYSKPDEAHIHDISGAYTFQDQFVLSSTNGLSEGDWVLEATVWGHEDNVEVTAEQVEFHITP